MCVSAMSVGFCKGRIVFDGKHNGINRAERNFRVGSEDKRKMNTVT